MQAFQYADAPSLRDNTWILVNPIAIAYLEYRYYIDGGDALKFVDPEWAQGEYDLLPFRI